MELKIFNRGPSVSPTACAFALPMLKPIDAITGPLADRPSHLRDVLSHVLQVSAVICSLYKLSVTLGHHDRIVCKFAVPLVEVNLHVELSGSVDAGGATGDELTHHIILVDV